MEMEAPFDGLLTRFNARREYSSLATTSAQQCDTCYGRDATIASRSINTERRSAALVLTRKQKAIVRPSVSFQQGGPGFHSNSSNVRCHIVRPAACIRS